MLTVEVFPKRELLQHKVWKCMGCPSQLMLQTGQFKSDVENFAFMISSFSTAAKYNFHCFNDLSSFSFMPLLMPLGFVLFVFLGS